MRSLDCSRDVPFAENTRQFVDEETYDAVVLANFLAQNCGRRGCGWNRNVCGKLQGRTDLQLTPMAAYESFL
jgi:hypothetical protein